MADRQDKLTVNGLGRALDGVYVFDFIRLLSVGAPESLTGHESHYIRTKTGLRGGELLESAAAGDVALYCAVAVVVLGRSGKNVEFDKIMDAPWGQFVDVELDQPADPEVPAEQVPPASPPPAETGSPSKSGGLSSVPTSENPENAQSPTGPQDSRKSATSDPETLAI